MQKCESPSGSAQGVRQAAENVLHAHAVCVQQSGGASC